MGLVQKPYSLSAKNLCNDLYRQVHAQLRRKRDHKALAKAVEAITADLLAIPVTTAGPGYAFRPVRSNSFANSRVGLQPFTEAKKALDALGYLTFEVGSKATDWGAGVSRATTFQTTPAFNGLASSYGITHANRTDHFRRRYCAKTLGCPVELRTASKRTKGTYGDKIPGKKMAFDKTSPSIAAQIKRMSAVNGFLFSHDISGADFNGLRRVFANVDKCKALNEGARLYGWGGCYQSLPSVERAKMTINGEPVAELDISSSHISILCHFSGCPVAPGVDLYSQCNLPRTIAKMFVTQTMGSNKLPRAWSKDQKAKYADRRPADVPLYTGDLQKDYPVSETREAVVEGLPVLRGWNAGSIRWGTLQFRESEAILSAMEELIALGIPSLPLHDALIVPVSKIQVAQKCIQNAFLRVIGFIPTIKMK